MEKKIKESKILKGIKTFFSQLFQHFSLNARVLLYLGTFAILTCVFVFYAMENRIFVVFLLLLWGFTIVQTVKKIAQWKEMKSVLRAIYQGENKIVLEEEQFYGELKEVAHYINDISGGFSNAVEQGIKSEKMKAELITNVSHDIKTPLTSIISYVDLLKKEKIQNEKAQEYIGILETKSQRLKRLIEDLVEASN